MAWLKLDHWIRSRHQTQGNNSLINLLHDLFITLYDHCYSQLYDSATNYAELTFFIHHSDEGNHQYCRNTSSQAICITLENHINLVYRLKILIKSSLKSILMLTSLIALQSYYIFCYEKAIIYMECYRSFITTVQKAKKSPKKLGIFLAQG